MHASTLAVAVLLAIPLAGCLSEPVALQEPGTSRSSDPTQLWALVRNQTTNVTIRTDPTDTAQPAQSLELTPGTGAVKAAVLFYKQTGPYIVNANTVNLVTPQEAPGVAVQLGDGTEIDRFAWKGIVTAREFGNDPAQQDFPNFYILKSQDLLRFAPVGWGGEIRAEVRITEYAPCPEPAGSDMDCHYVESERV